MRISNPGVRALQDQIEDDDVMRWAGTLPRARVTRWGGMISTPDAVLQAMIKRSLQESGCPGHIVTELMENAHERRWPPGLQTLETRQMNRWIFVKIIPAWFFFITNIQIPGDSMSSMFVRGFQGSRPWW